MVNYGICPHCQKTFRGTRYVLRVYDVPWGSAADRGKLKAADPEGPGVDDITEHSHTTMCPECYRKLVVMNPLGTPDPERWLEPPPPE